MPRSAKPRSAKSSKAVAPPSVLSCASPRMRICALVSTRSVALWVLKTLFQVLSIWSYSPATS